MKNIKFTSGVLLAFSLLFSGCGGGDGSSGSSDGGTINSSEIATFSIEVLKTGQIKSYDVNGTEITDGSQKDDGFYKSGLARSYTRDVNDTVTENTTKLIWQDDTTPASMTWDSAITYCQNLTLGGHTDWRLPDIKELQTLVDNSKSDPSMDSIFQNTISSYYWSITSYVALSSNAWSVHFFTGYTSADDKTDSNINVRCVKSI